LCDAGPTTIWSLIGAKSSRQLLDPAVLIVSLRMMRISVHSRSPPRKAASQAGDSGCEREKGLSQPRKPNGHGMSLPIRAGLAPAPRQDGDSVVRPGLESPGRDGDSPQPWRPIPGLRLLQGKSFLVGPT